SEWNNYKWGPVTPSTQAPTLINKEGFLYSTVDSVKQFATSNQVEEEIRDQVKRAIQFGIDPTHLDAHMIAVVRNPDFLKAYIKVGREYKIPVFLARETERELNLKLDDLILKNEIIADSIVSIMPDRMQSNPAGYYAQTLRSLPVGLTYFIIHTA